MRAMIGTSLELECGTSPRRSPLQSGWPNHKKERHATHRVRMPSGGILLTGMWQGSDSMKKYIRLNSTSQASSSTKLHPHRP